MAGNIKTTYGSFNRQKWRSRTAVSYFVDYMFYL